MLAGSVEIKQAKSLSPLISLMLWGPSGVGKTTFAATLPGRKLLINFDPQGYGSVADRDDVSVADFSSATHQLAESFKSDTDPLGLRKYLGDFDSFIVDSLSTVQELTLSRGIANTKGATVERPSPGAYGARNTLTLALVSSMLKFCNNHGKHVCFIAHEGAPEKSEDGGGIVGLPIYLGGQLPALTSLRFSEVWAMYDLGTSGRAKKKIAIRPCRMRSPMKSRMFDTRGEPEFDWNYDPITHEGDTIEQWHTQWLDGGKKKIALPR